MVKYIFFIIFSCVCVKSKADPKQFNSELGFFSPRKCLYKGKNLCNPWKITLTKEEELSLMLKDPKQYKPVKQSYSDTASTNETNPLSGIQKACDSASQTHVICGDYVAIKRNIENIGREIAEKIPYPTATAVSTFLVKSISEQRISFDVR